jgi:hypothetical protein
MSKPQLKIVDNFLHNLKIIIKEVSELLPNDPQLYRANKRILLAIQYSPLEVLNTVGLYLYKYKDFVYDPSTEGSLINYEFMELHTINNVDVETISTLLISEIKKCVIKMDMEGKLFFRKLVISLLDDYIEYQYLKNNS